MLGVVPGPCSLCLLTIQVLWVLEVPLLRCFTVGGRSRLSSPDLTSDSVLGFLPTRRTQDHLLTQGQTPPHGTLCPGWGLCGLEAAPGPLESRHMPSYASVPSVGGGNPSPPLL